MEPILSILIPVYNYDCREMVAKLLEEIEREQLSVEILLGNDASENRFTSIYESISDSKRVRLFSVTQNIGAGRMRNHLAREAKGKYLLYMDSDTMPLSEDFITRYINAIEGDKLIYGGFQYPELCPSSTVCLRYLYGTKVEMRSLEERKENPYEAFITMCFLIKRELMLEEGFPEELGMGYEDAFFGGRLRDRGIALLAIDNPVLHDLKETSLQFLTTLERYITNLYRHRDLFPKGYVKLLDAYRKIDSLHLGYFFQFLHYVLGGIIKRNLISRRPILFFLKLYKLLYIFSLK